MIAKVLAPLALAATLAAGACGAAPEPAAPAARPAVGLMTTLPLLWAEAGDIGELLADDAEPGWVRVAIEKRFLIQPLDTLDERQLAPLRALILAQPRALGPAENVALDAWVRGGGRLLLFADPMLTRESRFPVGDRRRPQDVALLSPILSHWGLELVFDEDQPEGERGAAIGGETIPVDLPGAFRTSAQSGCEVTGRGVLASCRVGQGRVVALADAAVLDDEEAGPPDDRADALAGLMSLAFD